MKKIYLILAAAVGMTITSCTTSDYLGDVDPSAQTANDGAIRFGYKVQGTTRAGELVGDAAAAKLGNMFVVEGTKGTEADDAPSSTVVFDNYLVGFTYNTAATTESNSNNWEYVGKETGITGRMTSDTWTGLHTVAAPAVAAKEQSIKFWDYSTDQYDFIAWSTGNREAVTDAAADGKVKVTRINTGTTLASDGFTLTAYDVDDLMECYYTDINTVLRANYGQPVTLTFKNMATKVRVALYETIPGYSVKDVKFYSSDTNPTAPTDLGTGTSDDATLFTTGTGSDVLPQSGAVLVYYPHIGKTHRDATPAQTKDYNKASVTVNPISGGGGAIPTAQQAFGALTDNYTGAGGHESNTNIYLGRTLPQATFAGSSADNYYTAVFPNSSGKTLTLRVDYTLVSTDGYGEEIHVYGAKAVVPSTYTEWQPNYAYTYIFKISDNTNGWTGINTGAPQGDPGLFPITFDAVVTNFVDVNAEQTTVTTVSTPSITTYQQGHTYGTNEYSKSQKAGVDQTNVKDLYVQVMKTDGSTPPLVADLNGTNKSLLFKVSKANATEAEVMDALQDRTTLLSYSSVTGRNGITLINNTNISNTVTSIVNGVDDQPITKIAGTAISAGQVAKIDIDQLTTGTYAYVYASTVPDKEEKIFNIVSPTTAEAGVTNYYEIDPTNDIIATPLPANSKAVAGMVYFVKNVDANGDFVSYTFKQTKVGDDVSGLVRAVIPSSKASVYTAGHFYFDVYNQNNGAYAVKVFKVVA